MSDSAPGGRLDRGGAPVATETVEPMPTGAAAPTAEGAGPAATETAAVASEARRAPIRRPLAVLLSRFPLITETFILREIVELERQGQPVRLVPLIRERPDVVHAEARPWIERALTASFFSPAVLAANLRALRRRPGDYLSTLWLLVWGTLTSWNFLIRTLVLFPKAVWLAERLEREGVRHVHAHFATHPTTAALVVAALTDITFSFTAHAHDIFVRQQLLEEKLRRARAVRTISEFNRSYLQSRYPEAAAGKIEVIPVGIDVDGYAPEPSAPVPTEGAVAGGEQEPTAPFPPTSRPARLLSVAALQPYKGQRVLLEACARLRQQELDFRCDIVGEGPERGFLERRIAELGLAEQVRLLGARPQDEVRELLAAADVFVLPSVVAADGQMEGLPVAIMEAMAAGLPVVASRLSGIPELVVDGDTGLLTEPGDAADLAGAIRDLLVDQREARRIGQRGRARVAATHRLDDSVGRLIDLVIRFDPPLDATSSNGTQTLIDQARAGPLGARLCGRLGVRRCRESADSIVVELMAPASSPPELVLKRPLRRLGQSRPPLLRTRRELEVLRRLYNAGLGVPRPVGLDAEHGVLLMERCAGRRLDRRIRDLRLRLDAEAPRRLAEACRQTGRWLRRFQGLPLLDLDGDGGPGGGPALVAGSAAPGEGGAAPGLGGTASVGGGMTNAGAAERLVEARLVEAELLLERCRDRGFLPSGGRDVLDWLEMLRASLDLDRLGPVPMHGDFWPGNVFVAEPDPSAGDGPPLEDPTPDAPSSQGGAPGPGVHAPGPGAGAPEGGAPREAGGSRRPGIEVVDFEGYGAGLRWEDAASFLVHLELYFAYPLLRRRGGTAASGFLAGFLASDPPDEAAARFCRVLAALRVLAHSAVRRSGPLHARQRRVLRHIVFGD